MKNSYRIIEICCLIFCIIPSATLGVGFNNTVAVAKVDAWMSPIIGTIIGIIPLCIFIYIFNYKPELNIHEKINDLFGNFFGKIINILLIIEAILLLSSKIYNLITFVSSEYLYNTPKLFISFFFIIAIIYIFSKGFKILCRANVIFMIFTTILFMISFFGLLLQIKLDNVLPILEHGFEPPLIGGILHMGYSILPLFAVTMIPKQNIKNNEKFSKYLFFTFLLGNLSVIIITFFVISIFGIDLASLYQYSSFHILKRALSSGVFERLESILAIQWIIYLFISILIFIYYTLSGIEYTFKTKKLKSKNYIYYLIIIFIFMIGTNLYKSNTAFNFASLNYSPYALYFAYFLIPIIIAIRIKFKK